MTGIVPAPIAPPPTETSADKPEQKSDEKTGAEVVTLDSFRKR